MQPATQRSGKSLLAKARQILEVAPDVFVARRIVIQSLLNGPDPARALPFIEAGLTTRPKSLELNMMKLNALSRTGDGAGGIAQLKAMYRDFPDNSDVQAWLTEWYVNDAPPAEAIAFLRDLATRQGNDPAQHDYIADYVEGHFPGHSAADELYRIANAYPEPAIADRYRARAAAVRFAEGETGEAISEMRSLMQGNTALSKSSPFRMALANMLIKVGQTGEALPLIDSVLAEDPKRVDAPVLKAQWQIQGGDIQGAITTLTSAISWAGKDPQLLTLLAEAYEKNGNTELARSSLLDAVTVSHNGVRETRLLVRFLQRTDGKGLMIDDILTKALEAHPGDPELVALARQSQVGITAEPEQ